MKKRGIKKKTKKEMKGFFQKLKSFVFKVVLYFFGISLSLVLFFKFVPVPFTFTMLEQRLSEPFSKTLDYHWKPIELVSSEMAIAVIAAEDQQFPFHQGFDIIAIKKAIKRNQNGGKLRGGSTISQQTAKNVFLWQGRSWLRKGLEVYFTFLIELIWGKERILEVYLNVMETGYLTFGAEAASQKYFNKPSMKLTRLEACRIAAILPSPRNWKASSPGPYVLKRTNYLSRQIQQLGGIKYLEKLRD